MIKLDRPVIVEGKYDIIKLNTVIDGIIIKTDGFGIFKDKEKQKLIRRLAAEKGIIILTDSDSAGFLIRNFIKSTLPEDKITHVYIPDIKGKEKRKAHLSKEGKLGVEGIDENIIKECFRKADVFCEETNKNRRLITPLDFYEHGLSGRENSKENRKALLKKLDLPERMSSSSMIKILNSFITFEEFEKTVKELKL